MIEPKKISIIVPVYNAEEYLDECIKSIVMQSYQNIEIILVNDGATDDSLDICHQWQERDSRVVCVSKENGGVSSARNMGLENASGDYVAFVDADDYVVEDYCERLLSHIDNDIDMVVLGLVALRNGQTSPISHRLTAGIYQCADLKKMVVDDGTMSGFTIHSQCAVLYRKDIIKTHQISFNKQIKYNEDGLFNVEYIMHCLNNIYIDYSESIYVYRQNAESASHKVDLLSDYYTQTMQNIEKVLFEYDRQYPKYNISDQIEMRFATYTLSAVINCLNNSGSTKIARTLLKNQRLRNGLKKINFKKLSNKKKIIYVLMKLKAALLFKIILNVNSIMSHRNKEKKDG